MTAPTDNRKFIEWCRESQTEKSIYLMDGDARSRLMALADWSIDSKQTLWVASLCDIATLRLDLAEARAQTQSLESAILDAHRVLPATWAYCGPFETLGLLVAEIATCRTEREEARAQVAERDKQIVQLKAVELQRRRNFVADAKQWAVWMAERDATIQRLQSNADLPAAVAGQRPCEDSPYRVGRTLGTTIYNRGEDQPCAWVPDNTSLAAKIVELLNRDGATPQADEKDLAIERLQWEVGRVTNSERAMFEHLATELPQLQLIISDRDAQLTACQQQLATAREALALIVARATDCFAQISTSAAYSQSIAGQESGQRLAYSVVARIARPALAALADSSQGSPAGEPPQAEEKS